MVIDERLRKLPGWIKRATGFLTTLRIPGKIVCIITSLLATLWFLFRVIPKPSRAAYPCMQVAAPMMSGFVIWILTITGSALAFRKAKHRLSEARYASAFVFMILGIGAASIFIASNPDQASATAKNNVGELEIWYKPNLPKGVARGEFPGRVAWGHNPHVASWDGKTGFWW